MCEECMKRWEKPIFSRPGVPRPEGERPMFVHVPLYVGGGGSCTPEACMWVVPGFRRKSCPTRKGGGEVDKEELRERQGQWGGGRRQGCLHGLRAPGPLCSVPAGAVQDTFRIVSCLLHCPDYPAFTRGGRNTRASCGNRYNK